MARFNRRNLIRYLLVLIFCLPSAGYSQSISGFVTGIPFNNPLPGINVIVSNNADGEILASVSTDSMGYYSASYEITSVEENNLAPKKYSLSHAYPNPFNPSTNIIFTTPVSEQFAIEIYNILGERVFNKEQTFEPGNYTLSKKYFED